MAVFGDTISFDLAVTFAIACLAIYAYIVRKRNVWSRKGIPVDTTSILLGHLKEVILRKKTVHHVIRDLYLKNKDKPFVTFQALSQPMVMIIDMEIVKKVLIKDFQFFPDRNVSVSPNDTLSFYNMFQARGDFWRNLRVKLSPTFTSGKLKKMFELMDRCGKGLVDYLAREKDQQGDIEVREATARFTSDIITSTAFGLEGDALVKEESAFRNIMRESVTAGPIDGMLIFLAFLFPRVIESLGIVITKKIVADFGRSTVWQTVEHREKNNIKRNDFLELMMQLRKTGRLDDDEEEEEEEEKVSGHKDNGRVENGITKDNIVIDGDVFVSQCLLFMAAGFETSSTTMSWALYEMALQPDIQQRAYDEITEVLEKHGGKVTYEAIQEMTYLNMLVHETLRKYPVLSFLDRRVSQPYKLPGTDIVLERGQGVLIPVLGIHSDPDIYPEPERFDPERFSAENTKQRPACSFLGFGDGPRICIGMRMGLVQTKVGLVYLLKNFAVSPCEKTQVPIVFNQDNVIYSPKGGITLRLQKRI